MTDNKKQKVKIRNTGFTLIELMITVTVIAILASIAMANYSSAKEKSVDATMKSDLRGAMLYIENYRIEHDTLPPNLADFVADTNFRLSPEVQWERFEPDVVDGDDSIALEVSHPQSTHNWSANYPANGVIFEAN